MDDPYSGSHQPSENVCDLSESSSNNVLQDINLCHSEHWKVPRRRFEIEGDEFIQNEDIFLCSSSTQNIKEALSHPSNDKWNIALQKEMSSINQNKVWTLVDLPRGRKASWNKWVLKIKRNVDGTIERYKAWLVEIHSIRENRI